MTESGPMAKCLKSGGLFLLAFFLKLNFLKTKVFIKCCTFFVEEINIQLTLLWPPKSLGSGSSILDKSRLRASLVKSRMESKKIKTKAYPKYAVSFLDPSVELGKDQVNMYLGLVIGYWHLSLGLKLFEKNTQQFEEKFAKSI